MGDVPKKARKKAKKQSESEVVASVEVPEAQ